MGIHVPYQLPDGHLAQTMRVHAGHRLLEHTTGPRFRGPTNDLIDDTQLCHQVNSCILGIFPDQTESPLDVYLTVLTERRVRAH